MTEEGGAASGHRFARHALPITLVGGLAILAGALLVSDCTPLPNGTTCSVFSNGTCYASGNCPYAPVGVVLLLIGLIVLAVGIALYVGRRPEGEEPHPEPGEMAKKAPKETALTRMEREQREAQEARRQDED